MLSSDEVLEIFKIHMPENVHIRMVTKEEYIQCALGNPFIQKQIQVGIYDFANIWTDFLSGACAYPGMDLVEVCYDILHDHMEGVDDVTLCHAYITMMALHEAHHFHADESPQGWEEHTVSETACIQAVSSEHPDLSSEVERFEAASAVFQRVYERMRSKLLI